MSRIPFTSTPDLLEAAREEADRTAISPVESVSMTPRPSSAPTYKELELDERGTEQTQLFAADGIADGRQPATDAAGTGPRARAHEHAIDGWQVLADDARQQYSEARAALNPYRTRGPKAKFFYWLRTLAFLLGDIAGISGAALLLGETYLNSYVLALSAATATVVAGFVGKDLRLRREALRRRCDADDLPESLRPFAHLFRGEDDGFSLVTRMGLLSLAIGILIAAGVFGLRSVDGPVTGLVFGGVAAAVAAGSVWSSWAYASEIDDLLETLEHDWIRATRQAGQEAAGAALHRHLEAEAEAASIAAEAEHRGQAARAALTSVKWRTLAGNPGVVGHGPAEPAVRYVKREETVR